jgi:Fe-S oxidoreductase
MDGAAATIRHNNARIAEMGAKTVVMTCPGCYRVWKEEYLDVVPEKHGFDVLHATEYIGNLIDGGNLKMNNIEKTVTYHDPCDLGRNSGIYQPPRDLLARIPGLQFRELAQNREFTSCCGSGGDLLACNQELAMEIAGKKVAEIQLTGADTVATACPSCVRAISMARTTAKAQLNVTDISELVWNAVQGE